LDPAGGTLGVQAERVYVNRAFGGDIYHYAVGVDIGTSVEQGKGTDKGSYLFV